MSAYFFPQIHVEGAGRASRLLFLFTSVFVFFLHFQSILKTTAYMKLAQIAFTLIVLLASLQGVLTDNQIYDFLSHLQYYLAFGLSFSVAATIEHSELRRFFEKSGKYMLFIFLFSAAVIVAVYTYSTSASRISVNTYFVGVPLAAFAFLYRKERLNTVDILFVILAALIALSSLKRSIIIAVFFLGLLVSIRALYQGVNVGRTAKTVALVSSALFVFVAFSFVTLDAFQNTVVQKATVSDRGINVLDNLSSGRVSSFWAVIGSFDSAGQVLFGHGFGAQYDAMLPHGDSFFRQSWVKTGADVPLTHFILIHGVILGPIIFTAYMVTLLMISLSAVFSNDRVELFLIFAAAFIMVSNLASFVAYDPLLPVLLGCLYSLKRARRSSAAYR